MNLAYKSKNKTEPTTLVRDFPRTGRNAKCPCGSDKKFKYCCIDTVIHNGTMQFKEKKNDSEE